MNLVLTATEISSLSPSTRAELMALVFPKAPPAQIGFPEGFDADDFGGVVDLTPGQIEEFMQGCSDKTVAGLKIIAQHGPKVHASLLDAADIDNYGHFQGSVTKRTRTVTGDRDAFLFAWDNWPEQPEGIGHYAVTQATHRSLRIFFDLD